MKFVIFHGAFGNPSANWFPYLEEQLFRLKQHVIVPAFPVENWDEVTNVGMRYVPKKQNLKNWLHVFEKEYYPKIKRDKNLCFVGHSLGPIFILHLVEKFNIQLNSAIFVAPFFHIPGEKVWQINLVNDTFYTTKFNFKKIGRLIPISYVVHSNNDPYVKADLSRKFGRKLGSSFIVVRGGKHMNTDAGFTKFPIVAELCKTRLDPKTYL